MARVQIPQNHDLNLEIAAGTYANYKSVNKFGRTTNADAGVATDVWDQANATADDDIWTAPTQARVHAIVSDNDTDGKTAAPNSVGARTLRVYGLTSWDAAEVSEDITLDGTTAVNTTNSYVIVHRMKVLTKGATNVNVGLITATAATDATITASILAGQGQTQMAVYGIPSTQKAYMTAYYASVLKAAAALTCAVSLLVNPEPDAELINFLVKHTNGLDTAGTSYMRHKFEPYFGITGPAIVKLQVNANKADSDVSGGFDLILVDN